MSKIHNSRNGKNIEYCKISGDDEVTLLNRAENNEIVLYALLKPHKAELKAHYWVENPKIYSRELSTYEKHPVYSTVANALLYNPFATVDKYFAADTDDSAHPFYEHYFELEEPQEISREQLYYKAALSTDACQEVNSSRLNEPETKDKNPWEIVDTRDPEPEQSWYTPARYFARQLVKKDSNLLIKRSILAQKVTHSLTHVGIKKRGGAKPFNPETVKKAFNKVNLG